LAAVALRTTRGCSTTTSGPGRRHEQLGNLLDRADLTQAAAADRADIHHDTLQRILPTRTNFDRSSPVRASHALDAEVVITLVPRRADSASVRPNPGHVAAP
jgi:hypothetical protein